MKPNFSLLKLSSFLAGVFVGIVLSCSFAKAGDDPPITKQDLEKLLKNPDAIKLMMSFAGTGVGEANKIAKELAGYKEELGKIREENKQLRELLEKLLKKTDATEKNAKTPVEPNPPSTPGSTFNKSGRVVYTSSGNNSRTSNVYENFPRRVEMAALDGSKLKEEAEKKLTRQVQKKLREWLAENNLDYEPSTEWIEKNIIVGKELSPSPVQVGPGLKDTVDMFGGHADLDGTSSQIKKLLDIARSNISPGLMDAITPVHLRVLSLQGGVTLAALLVALSIPIFRRRK